jgi:glycosyltransferase involved in cell wall biosynthesis
MAAGLPVIGTAVGGIVDFLKDGETGLVCEVKNPESIAEQVKRLMDDKELREKIVTNGRRLAEEKYDWDLIASQMRSRVFAIA